MKKKNVAKRFMILVLGLVIVMGPAVPVMADSLRWNDWFDELSVEIRNNIATITPVIGDLGAVDTITISNAVSLRGVEDDYSNYPIIHAAAPVTITILHEVSQFDFGYSFSKSSTADPGGYDFIIDWGWFEPNNRTVIEVGATVGATLVLSEPGIYATNDGAGQTIIIVVRSGGETVEPTEPDTPSIISSATINLPGFENETIDFTNVYDVYLFSPNYFGNSHHYVFFFRDGGYSFSQRLLEYYNDGEYTSNTGLQRQPTASSVGYLVEFVRMANGVDINDALNATEMDYDMTRRFIADLSDFSTPTEPTEPTTPDGVAPNLNTASNWAHDGITQAFELGLIPAALQNNYTANATRAEFAALAVALYETITGIEITGRMQFNDTSDINVEKMGYLEVVGGVGEGNFAPDTGLTRQEAAVMLARLANAIGQPLPPSAPTFADNAAISSWATDAVGQMQAAGIMGGTGNNNFSPQGDYTREQSIITILRLFEMLN